MAEPVKLLLCGDVMLGRGVDQALPHPCAPDLHEPAMDSALDYLGLAEQAHGPLSLPLDFASVWGVMRDEPSPHRMHASSTSRPALPAATITSPRASTTA